jgi:hypothetical protein
MYLPITQWLNQNPILFPCGRNMRSNHVAPPSLPHHTLNLSLLLTLILLFVGPLPYILRLLTMLLLLTTLLLFIVGSLKRDRTISEFRVHIP